MPEYSADLPLWLSDWWELGLNPELLNRLADWQEVFDGNFDPSEGWRNDAVRDGWRSEGERLASQLREAVPETVKSRSISGRSAPRCSGHVPPSGGP